MIDWSWGEVYFAELIWVANRWRIGRDNVYPISVEMVLFAHNGIISPYNRNKINLSYYVILSFRNYRYFHDSQIIVVFCRSHYITVYIHVVYAYVVLRRNGTICSYFGVTTFECSFIVCPGLILDYSSSLNQFIRFKHKL